MLRTYRSQIERTIRPTLGKVTLTRLTAKNLDSLYGAMKDAGKSPKTIRNHTWDGDDGGCPSRHSTLRQS